MEDKDYVTFEVAKLLKEKGYNEPCIKFYCAMYNGISDCIKDGLRFKYVTYKDLEEGDILIPSLYEAKKWIRKNWYDINVFYSPIISNSDKRWLLAIRCFCKEYDIFVNSFKTYEEALNNGIKISLNYI